MADITRLTLVTTKRPRLKALLQWIQEKFDPVTAVTSKTAAGGVIGIDVEGPGVPALIEAAEAGTLDAGLRPYGIRWVQEITRGPADDRHFNSPHLYDYVPAVEFMPPAIAAIGADELRALVPTIDLVVLTTTPIEQAALYAVMTPLPNRRTLLEGALDHATYRLGRLGCYAVAHVASTMSGEGRDGSPLTLVDAIDEIAPKAVIVVGIAFGIDRVKQRSGDVIVAETVVPYELAKVADKVTPRGQPLPCGPVLSERFRSRRHDWQLVRGLSTVKVHPGLLLSGAKLVDNERFRDSLREQFPGAQGGEMEGAGAYAAAARRSVEIILVKAICDWADGHKNDRAQPFAAHAAVSLVHHVVSKPEVLRAIGARDVVATKVPDQERDEGPLTAFVGRETELDELARLQKVAGALCIRGLHGIGKTSLVREYARRTAGNNLAIHYVSFQRTAQHDGSLVDEFLPNGPSDPGLMQRVWIQLRNLPSAVLIIFDEIESLLYHAGELDVVQFLRRLLYTRGGIVIARRDWAELEWLTTQDSPMLNQFGTLHLRPLGRDDARKLIRTLAPGIDPARAEAIAELSGGVPLLIREWCRPAGTPAASDHALYLTWLHTVDWYFRSTWQSLSGGEQRTLVAAVVERLGGHPPRDEEYHPTVNAEALGATSAAFAWWLSHNRVELRALGARNSGARPSSSDRYLLRALDAARSKSTVPELLNAWTSGEGETQ